MSNTEIKYAIRCDTLEQADECRPYSAFTMDSTGEFMKQEWYTIITYEESKIKIRIDYLNKEREVRHIFTDWENVWWEITTILNQWATDVHIYLINQPR